MEEGTQEDPLDLVGDLLDDQFRIDAFAGEGGLSVVYKGRHLGVDAPVAVKCLNLPSSLDEALARPIVESFHEGCRLHYKLARGSLNVAQTMASGTTIAPRTGATVPYLVREWLEGESLAGNLRRRRAESLHGRSLDAALTLLESAAEGLGYAHAQRVAHLSVSPSNLFIARRGDTQTTKVLDFGVGRMMDEAAPDVRPGQGVGLHVLFPAYAAPEQLLRTLGTPGPSSDVYSFALVFLEVLSDRMVIDEKDFVSTMERVLDPKIRPSALGHGVKVSEAVEAVFAKAFSLDPAQRYANVAELFRALQEAAPRRDSIRVSANTGPKQGKNPSLFRRLRHWRTWSAGHTAEAEKPAPAAAQPGAAASIAPVSVVPVPSVVPVAISDPPPPKPALTVRKSVPPRAPSFAPAKRAPALPHRPPPPAPRPRVPTLLATYEVAPPRESAPEHAPPAAPPAPEPAPNHHLPTPVVPPLAASLAPSQPDVPKPALMPKGLAGSDFPFEEITAVEYPVLAALDPLPAIVDPPKPKPKPEPASPALASSLRDEELGASEPVPVPVVPAPAPPPPPPPPALAPAPAPPLAPFLAPSPLADPLPEPVARKSRIGLVVGLATFVLLAGGGITAVRWASHRTVAVAPTTPPSAVETASASAPEPTASVVAPPPPPTASVAASVAPAPKTPFNKRVALAALDKVGKDLSACRRHNGLWGIGGATITFANDGTISKLTMGPPFRAAPEGICVNDRLMTAKIAPFAGPSPPVVYTFVVPLWPKPASSK